MSFVLQFFYEEVCTTRKIKSPFLYANTVRRFDLLSEILRILSKADLLSEVRRILSDV